MARIGTVIRDVYRRSGAEARALGQLLGQIHCMVTEAGPSERPAGSLHYRPDYEGLPGCDLAAATAMLADLAGASRPRSEPGPRATRVIQAI